MEQLEVAWADRAIFHQRVELDHLAPVFGAEKHDRHVLACLARLNQRQDLKQLVECAIAAREQHDRLREIDKPCDRRSPGKEDGCNLKPFEATQRVRHPPGRGAARQPEASLAWEAVTSLVKRRQRKLKPCVSLEIMYPLRPSVWFVRGRCRHDR